MAERAHSEIIEGQRRLPTNAPIDDVSGGTSTASAQGNPGDPGSAIVSALASSASASSANEDSIVSAVNNAGSFSQSEPRNTGTLAGAIVSGHPSDLSSINVLGQTLSPGQATTVDGTGTSVASDRSVVLEGGQATSTVPIMQVTPSPQATLTAGGHTLTLQQDPGHGRTLIINGTSTETLQASGTALLAGLTVSAETNGGSPYLVVGPRTVAVGAHTALASRLSLQTSGPTSQAVVTLG
ncbi:hypothetical protein LTR15_001657 [Elasticomyces elasticus]|nr:hypothetical protein LTR15_001657 [Elasticomyces elasticus]